MQTVPVNLGTRSYEILVGRGLLHQLGLGMAARLGGADGRLAVVVSSPEIARLYGEAVTASLSAAGFRVKSVLVPPGEISKSLASAEELYAALHALSADRRTVVVALGGGVIGDLAGFAAATYTRGLEFVQVPTTLLAQVDSSVGGKTGVNLG